VVDSDGNAHDVPQFVQPRKKRKMNKDGRPEPLIRQWLYSKVFHDLYTTKEAYTLRKKILNWKCSGMVFFIISSQSLSQLLWFNYMCCLSTVFLTHSSTENKVAGNNAYG